MLQYAVYSSIHISQYRQTRSYGYLEIPCYPLVATACGRTGYNVLPALPKLSVFSDSIFPDGGERSSSTPLLDFVGVDICGCLSGFKYMIFLGADFLRYGHVSSRQPNKISLLQSYF